MNDYCNKLLLSIAFLKSNLITDYFGFKKKAPWFLALNIPGNPIIPALSMNEDAIHRAVPTISLPPAWIYTAKIINKIIRNMYTANNHWLIQGMVGRVTGCENTALHEHNVSSPRLAEVMADLLCVHFSQTRPALLISIRTWGGLYHTFLSFLTPLCRIEPL